MADEAKLLALIEANTKQFENALKRVERSTAQTFQRSAQSTRRLDQALNQTANNANRLTAALTKAGAASRTIGGAFAGGGRGLVAPFIGALSAREVIRYADAWKEAGNRLAATSAITGRQARSLEDLNKIASETRSSLGTTVELYAKLLLATKDVAGSEEEVARATEIVNKAFKAGGAAASEQASGILQLSQALSSGVLQGDELRSIRENAPLLARAIAQEFNTTIGGLKELGAQGQLTSERVFKGILRAQGEVEQAFAQTTPTISDAFTQLGNSAEEFVGKLDAAVGGSKALISVLNGLSETIRRIGEFGDLPSVVFGDLTNAGTVAEQATKFINDLLNNLNSFPEARRLVTDEQMRQLEQLRDELGKGTPEAAEAARVALDRLVAESPRRFQALADAVKPFIAQLLAGHAGVTALKTDIDTLTDSVGKLAALRRQAETQSMAALGAEQGETQSFLDARTAEAKRTEDEKRLDDRTDQILKEAEKLGLVLSKAAARIQAKAELAAENVEKMAAGTTDSAAKLIAHFEGFRSKAYFDVNHSRVGFGSDTMTSAAGQVSEVTRDSVTTVADAMRDLTRRIAEIQTGIINDVGADAYNKLSEETRASLISVAYNYGQLPKRLIGAIQTGDPTTIAAGVEGLADDNGGINRDRRMAEAANILGGPSGDAFQGIQQTADAHKQFQEQIQRTIEELGLENAALSQSDVEAERNRAAFQALQQAKEAGLEIGQRFSTLQELEAVKAGELTPELEAQRQAILALANAEGIHAQAALDASAAQQQFADTQQAAIEKADSFRGAVKDVLGGFISDLRQGKSLAEALGNALNNIADKLIDMALNSLISGLFGTPGSTGGGLLGGIVGAFVHHDGGVAGHGPQRLAPASAFAGAPRYHSGGVAGLQPGDVPSILKRGEVVLPQIPSLRPASTAADTRPVRVDVRLSEDLRAEVDNKVQRGVQISVVQSQKATRQNFGGMLRDFQVRQG